MFSVAFSKCGKYALTGSWDKTARLWDLHNLAAEPVVLQGHTDGIRSVAFSSDGKYALTGSDDYTVRLWDLEYKIKDLDLEQLLSILSPS